jgi:hypothetical protein
LKITPQDLRCGGNTGSRELSVPNGGGVKYWQREISVGMRSWGHKAHVTQAKSFVTVHLVDDNRLSAKSSTSCPLVPTAAMGTNMASRERTPDPPRDSLKGSVVMLDLTMKR